MGVQISFHAAAVDLEKSFSSIRLDLKVIHEIFFLLPNNDSSSFAISVQSVGFSFLFPFSFPSFPSFSSFLASPSYCAVRRHPSVVSTAGVEVAAAVAAATELS